MIPRRIVRGLIRLSDPNGCDGPAPRPADVPRLCEFADAHSVLPAVVSNLHRICGDSIAEALTAPRGKLMQRTAVSMLLRRQLAEITAAFADAGVPMVVIKGPAFADRLYADPGLRPFTDLDLLIPPDARDPAAAAMEQLGYRLVDQPGRKYDTEYGEQSWRRSRSAVTSPLHCRGSGTGARGSVDDRPPAVRGASHGNSPPATAPLPNGGDVEIHWNLVNSPTLRAGLSVGYSDLVTDGKMSAGALLIVAAVHGAASHQFDRVGLLWDIAQAASGHAGDIDATWLVDAARRTGCAKALAMSLHLAAVTLGQPKAAALRRELKLPRPSIVARWLLTPATVMGVRTPLVTARRLGFRQMLKRP